MKNFRIGNTEYTQGTYGPPHISGYTRDAPSHHGTPLNYVTSTYTHVDAERDAQECKKCLKEYEFVCLTQCEAISAGAGFLLLLGGAATTLAQLTIGETIAFTGVGLVVGSLFKCTGRICQRCFCVKRKEKDPLLLKV